MATSECVIGSDQRGAHPREGRSAGGAAAAARVRLETDGMDVQAGVPDGAPFGSRTGSTARNLAAVVAGPGGGRCGRGARRRTDAGMPVVEHAQLGGSPGCRTPSEVGCLRGRRRGPGHAEATRAEVDSMGVAHLIGRDRNRVRVGDGGRCSTRPMACSATTRPTPANTPRCSAQARRARKRAAARATGGHGGRVRALGRRAEVIVHLDVDMVDSRDLPLGTPAHGPGLSMAAATRCWPRRSPRRGARRRSHRGQHELPRAGRPAPYVEPSPARRAAGRGPVPLPVGRAGSPRVGVVPWVRVNSG